MSTCSLIRERPGGQLNQVRISGKRKVFREFKKQTNLQVAAYDSCGPPHSVWILVLVVLSRNSSGILSELQKLIFRNSVLFYIPTEESVMKRGHSEGNQLKSDWGVVTATVVVAVLWLPWCWAR